MQEKTITVEAKSRLGAALALRDMACDLNRITELIAECHPATQSVFAPFLDEVNDEIRRNLELIGDKSKGGAA